MDVKSLSPQTGRKIRSLAVFCSAREGLAPSYQELAREMGKFLASSGIELVYGGGRRGLMGEMALEALANGGAVFGVIPEALMERELGLTTCQEFHVVKTMHQRKALMAQRAQAFLALPGGFGTLDEIFEMITWRQLGYHEKPIVFINYGAYFQELLDFCRKMEREGFVGAPDFETIEIYQDLEEWIQAWKKLNRV
jgi:uncharacterized protein (TIGR00730 family)